MPERNVLTRPEDLQPGQEDVLCTFPHWYVPRQWRAPRGAVFLGFPEASQTADLPESLTRFLDSGDAPIVLAHSPWEKWKKWMQRLGRRVVVIGATGESNERIHFCQGVTADQVAARAAVVVHGGATEVCAACLMAGVSQLIVGQNRWSRWVGARLRELNVSQTGPVWLLRSRVGVKMTRRLLRAPGVARACAALREEVARRDPPPPADRGVVSMSLIGRFGRFGNELLQYGFLKTVARNNGFEVECARWSGEPIFGRRDARIRRVRRPAIERTDGPNLFDAVPELKRYIEHQAGGDAAIRVGPEALEKCPADVDLCGHWMFHTSKLAPYRESFRELFVPLDDVRRPLDDAVAKLRERGETLIGIQVRRGDFLSSPISTFTFAVPPAWWRDWVRKVWDASPRPVLYVASDDAGGIVKELAEFSPVTAKDLNVALPDRAAGSQFFVDHYMLSQCDAVAISNSSFGFTACLLNPRAKTFARATLSGDKFVEFDPWNTEPLLHFGKKPTRKTLGQMASITYQTQGLGATMKCLGWYLPRAIVRGAAIRAFMAYQSDGAGGAVKSLARTVTAPLRQIKA